MALDMSRTPFIGPIASAINSQEVLPASPAAGLPAVGRDYRRPGVAIATILWPRGPVSGPQPAPARQSGQVKRDDNSTSVHGSDITPNRNGTPGRPSIHRAWHN